MKKKLIEMYGLKEGPFDDLNRQLGSAKSVARDPRAPQQKARVAPSGAVQKAQADLDSSKSIFDETAGDDEDISLEFTKRELRLIEGWADEYADYDGPAAKSILEKVQKALGTGSSSSMSMSTSKKTPFGGGM